MAESSARFVLESWRLEKGQAEPINLVEETNKNFTGLFVFFETITIVLGGMKPREAASSTFGK